VEDWPALTIEFNHTTRHYCDMDPDDGFQHDPTTYTTYYPADAPNVLSPEETQDFADLYDGKIFADDPRLDRIGDVVNRIADYAKETEAIDA